MPKKDESNCFVGVVCERRGDDNRPQLLMAKIRWKKRPWVLITKFPGGMHKRTDKDFLATARREIVAEAGIKIREDASPVLIGHFQLKGQRRYFFLVREGDYRGQGYTHVVHDGDSEIETEWMNLDEALVQLHDTHQPIVPELLRKLNG